MYRIAEGLACKNRTNWLTGQSVGVGLVKKDTFPETTPKTPKKSLKCLIFNGLSFWGNLWGCFGVVLGLFWGMHQLLDFQRFTNIKQKLVFQRFYGAGR